MNRFSGELPSCMNQLTNLQELHMQKNKFSGKIPKIIAANWGELTKMDLSENQFSGDIPTELGCLPVLTFINLSNNQLTGEIPTELTRLKLDEFNVSNNMLTGKVPLGFDTKFFIPSLIGNPDLCGSTKPLPPCSKSTTKTASHITKTVLLALLSSLVFTLLVTITLVCLSIKTKTKTNNLGRITTESNNNKSWKITLFTKIEYKPEDVLASLKDENLIGSGGSGQVYQVRLEGGQTVAAKQLWETRGRSLAESEAAFRSEVEILGIIRHLNVVRLLFSGINDESKVLVYEYIKNGSLGDALHGNRNDLAVLDWPIHLNIAIGAAQGLAYLHHDCVPPIFHRDIKSNNILLDEDFRPKVADFGLAKTLKNDGDQVMSRFVGSYGYIAPVAEKSDVYSFGIVLLEMKTGKRPNDSFFGEDGNIVKWVKEIAKLSSSTRRGSVDDNEIEELGCLEEIFDIRMNKDSIKHDEVENLMNIALSCTVESPSRRPSMTTVVQLLKGC